MPMLKQQNKYLERGRKNQAFDFVMRNSGAISEDAMTIVEIFESQVTVDLTVNEQLTDQEIIELKHLIRKGQQLMAVKYIKGQINDIGLREAKNIVDRYIAIIEAEDKNDDCKF